MPAWLPRRLDCGPWRAFRKAGSLRDRKSIVSRCAPRAIRLPAPRPFSLWPASPRPGIFVRAKRAAHHTGGPTLAHVILAMEELLTLPPKGV